MRAVRDVSAPAVEAQEPRGTRSGLHSAWDRERIASGNAAESRQATSGSPADRRGGTDNS